MPRASVSTAIQHLEAELGARLLHRTTRRVSLTQDGQVFRERAQDLLGDLDELTGLFQREGASLRGRLRVDMPLGAARDHVIPALPDFCAAHPELELELSSTDRLVDVVREGFDTFVRAYDTEAKSNADIAKVSANFYALAVAPDESWYARGSGLEITLAPLP